MKNTKENNNNIETKLKFIGLELNKIENVLKPSGPISFKPTKVYDETSYKIYKFIDISKIEILITPTNRNQPLNEKYKLSDSLINYMDSNNEENIEKHVEFLEMLKKLQIEKIKEIELKQKEFQIKIPYEIKYQENFIWDIYYSEIEDKYFMLFPSKENQVEALFYLIKKKIEKSKEKIYVPIRHKEYSNEYLKKSEITDLENYLWLFTHNWPIVYEVQDMQGNITLQVIGENIVYEKVKSKYKIVFDNKEKTQNQFKLIKALFILQSNLKEEYDFKAVINQNGGLDFCYNRIKITYEILSQFIKQEAEKIRERIENLSEKELPETERLVLLQKTIEKKNREYLIKEKQIVTFLECKKSFIGRISYFFKGRKKYKKENIEYIESENKKDIISIEKLSIEKKEQYTIEDLLKICNILEEKEKKYKNMQMDIKALENKKNNIDRKIKNATLYINEIESHKKSIFDFWKFTNKDEVKLLTMDEEDIVNKKSVKKTFIYEDDIKEFAEKIDKIQRNLFSKKECDAIFAIKNDIETFNIVRKNKQLKKDDKIVEKILLNKKKKYQENIEKIKEKDFDIFGNVVEDKTKIKVLKNQKHREIEKDEYKILDINLDTTIEEYKDNIKHYKKILEDSYEKIVDKYNIPIYKIEKEELKNEGFQIFNLNLKEVVNKIDIESDEIFLQRINLEENIPIILYSNIMFFDNLNQTLPLGMDMSTEVLIDLEKYETKLVTIKDFNINLLKNEYDNIIKTIHVYEYNIEGKKIIND